MIKSKKPEVVILASGAHPIKPDIPGLKGDNVIDARDVLMGEKELKGPAVVLGAGYVGMETADYLLSRGIKVTILEMKTRSPVRKDTGHGYWLYHRIENSGGKIILNALVTRVDLNAVIYRQGSEEHRIEHCHCSHGLGGQSRMRTYGYLGRAKYSLHRDWRC